ncbi:MAG: hypothetical protein FD161_2030 [Limisphaerales bacterium]|nr:MAG: hypothetical protein FD161_2030 [Limisphaerales bacterium]KAG0509070.1 MAG: hypothetical protein E1N63_1832 [Limisphaerales bacterium]TXT44953.1 MAG: hypothetical protein FD140_4796 [Limisphaerales bacterium]
MEGLEQVITKLVESGVESEVWIDGSFLTEKTDPEDSDILVKVTSEFTERLNSQQEAVLNWIDTNLKDSHLCHSFVLASFPEGHVNYTGSQWFHAYWLRQFGFTRGDEPKGIAVIRTP